MAPGTRGFIIAVKSKSIGISPYGRFSVDTRGYTWKDLEVLHLDGMVFCELGLWDLLKRHTKTLSELVLSNMTLWSGSFQSLLQKIEDRDVFEMF